MAVVDITNTFQMSKSGEHIDNTDVINSNRNLLDNPWWGSGEVVNQRGVTSATVTNNTYFIDRWLTTYGSAAGTYSLGSAGLTLTPASGTTITVFQRLANAAAINGKTITLSAMMGNGTIYSGTIARTNGTAQVAFSNSAIALVMQSDNTFRVNVYSAQTIRAVKLELGSYSTLANDVPPDYGEELRKCQRYFVRIASSANAFPVAFGVKDSATIADIFVPTPVEMRVTPSTSKSGVHRVWGGNAASRDVSSYSTVAKTTTGVYLRATIASGSLADYYTYVIYLQNGAYIDLSADL